MSGGEKFYLIMSVLAFVVFTAALANESWQQVKARRTAVAAGQPLDPALQNG